MKSNKKELPYALYLKVLLDNKKSDKEKEKLLKQVKKEDSKVFECYNGIEEELNSIKEYMFQIDMNKVESYGKDINTLNEYIPVLLNSCLEDDYYDKLDKGSVAQIMISRHLVKSLDYGLEYANLDLMYWLNEHKQFEDIILW